MATAPKLAAAQPFKIIKNLPVPERGNGPGRKEFGTFGGYPFADMEVGDCFDAPCDMGKFPNNADRRQSHVSGSAASYRSMRNKDARFVTRKIGDEIIRCWRIA